VQQSFPPPDLARASTWSKGGEEDGLPVELNVQMRAPGGRSYALGFSEGILVYRVSVAGGAPGLASRVRPSEAQWRAFWDVVEGCRGWAVVYGAEGGSADADWRVALEHDGLRVESRGAGAYPENWRVFLDALRRLIGGREFG
jgi:hypothetical protein